MNKAVSPSNSLMVAPGWCARCSVPDGSKRCASERGGRSTVSNPQRRESLSCLLAYRCIGPRCDSIMSNGLVAISIALFDGAEQVVADGGGHALVGSGQVGAGGVVLFQLVARHAAAEVMVEPAVVAGQGVGEGALCPAVVAAGGEDVALQRMEARLGGLESDGVLDPGERGVVVLLVERFAALFVGVVGRLGGAQAGGGALV